MGGCVGTTSARKWSGWVEWLFAVESRFSGVARVELSEEVWGVRRFGALTFSVTNVEPSYVHCRERRTSLCS